MLSGLFFCATVLQTFAVVFAGAWGFAIAERETRRVQMLFLAASVIASSCALSAVYVS